MARRKRVSPYFYPNMRALRFLGQDVGYGDFQRFVHACCFVTSKGCMELALLTGCELHKTLWSDK